MFNFVMTDEKVGVYAVGAEVGDGDIGEQPVVVASGRSKEVVSIRDAPVPSLIQFEFTKRYAIKFGDDKFYQIADLDGHLDHKGGFVGYLHQKEGGCLVLDSSNPTEFLNQITRLRLKIVHDTHDRFTPAQRYIIGMLLKDI